MAKRRRKRSFSVFRFAILFLIAFGLMFAVGGGVDIFPKNAMEKAGEILPKENIVNETNKDLAFLTRVKRIIFIKNSVNAKVNSENFIKIDEMPRDLIHAIVAVEDSRFYTHCGFDIEAIGRASLVNLQYGRIEEGASTITQQLVKNLFLSSEQTFDRKIEEIILALDMEMIYNKEEILELYLNTIYFGSNFYGIKDAARGYFDKLPKDLTIEESAMLAGLPNAPSLYSPYVDMELAKKRQRIVLDAMEKNGYIINSTAEKAKVAPLYFARD